MLSTKTIKDMWTPKTDHMQVAGQPEFDYAYGWAIRRINDTARPTVRHRYIVWHNGGLAGASTMLYVYPDEEVVAIAMTNKGSMQGPLSEVVIRVVESIYDWVK